VLIGQGFDMRADPVAQFVPDDALFGFLDDLNETIEEVAQNLPSHDDFVARLPSSTDAHAAAREPQVNFTMKYERLVH